MIYPYRYSWRLTKLWGAGGSPLYNRRCRVVARALHGKNAREIEMENGERFIVSGNSLRKVVTS